jgi:hypothetical protein
MKPIGAVVAPCRDVLKWPYLDYFFGVLSCIFFLQVSLQFEFPNKHIMSTLTSYYPFYPFPNARFGIKDLLHHFHSEEDKFYELDPNVCSFFPDEVLEIIEHANTYTVLHGAGYWEAPVADDHVVFRFYTNGVGLDVAARFVKVCKVDGTFVGIEQVPASNARWLDYWCTYWRHGGTDQAFPKDLLCKITIPAG